MEDFPNLSHKTPIDFKFGYTAINAEKHKQKFNGIEYSRNYLC